MCWSLSGVFNDVLAHEEFVCLLFLVHLKTDERSHYVDFVSVFSLTLIAPDKKNKQENNCLIFFLYPSLCSALPELSLFGK